MGICWDPPGCPRPPCPPRQMPPRTSGSGLSSGQNFWLLAAGLKLDTGTSTTVPTSPGSLRVLLVLTSYFWSAQLYVYKINTESADSSFVVFLNSFHTRDPLSGQKFDKGTSITVSTSSSSLLMLFFSHKVFPGL